MKISKNSYKVVQINDIIYEYEYYLQKKLKKNMNKFQILTRIVKHKLFLGKKVGQNMWDSQHINV